MRRLSEKWSMSTWLHKLKPQMLQDVCKKPHANQALLSRQKHHPNVVGSLQFLTTDYGSKASQVAGSSKEHNSGSSKGNPACQHAVTQNVAQGFQMKNHALR